MKIYLVRHAQSVANSKGMLQGKYNSPLSKLGKQQASSIRLPKIYNIYTSPLMRAKQTAKIVMGNRGEIIEEFEEFDFGNLTGKKTKEMNAMELNLLKRLHSEYDNKDHNGESSNEFIKRVKKGFDKIINNKKDCVVFTHEGVIRAIINEILKIGNMTSIKSCEVIIIEYDEFWSII